MRPAHPAHPVYFVLGLGLCAFAACGERRSTGPVPHASTMDQRTDAVLAPPSASASAPPVAEARPPTYPALVREERWVEADAELAALPDAEKDRPALRYLRARVALARGLGKEAFPLLEKLEDRLPLLEVDIKKWRAEAALAAGAWAEAARYYEASGKARELVHAAEAQEKLGDKSAALRLAERAMQAADKGKGARDQIASRLVHARAAVALGGEPAALPDRRWLAMFATGADRRAAEKALDDAKKPLTRGERLTAAGALLERGATADALELLDGVADQKAADVRALRALVLVKGRRWKDALAAVEGALKVKTGREAELLYQQGRVLGRLGKHDESVKVMAEVARRHKKTPWGDKASYGIARTHLQRGKFAEAQRAYTAYLAAYPKGEKDDDAELDLALASLSAGDPKTARRTFEKLAKQKKNDESALMRELQAVSALKAKDKDAATALFKEVAKGWPLSFAAQSARSRLASLGAAPPAWIDPPPSGGAATPLEPKLPAVVELLSSLGLDGDAEAALAGMEQSAAQPYVGRESEALCAMYAKLSRAKRRYKVASAAVSYTTLLRAPAPSEKWQWECLYPRPYAETVRSLEGKNKLPKHLGFAIMRQESVFDPTVSSPAGAVGLLQLLPSTASAIAKETGYELGQKPLTSPEVNLTLGTAYLGKLLKTFQGSLPLAIAAYNAGPGAVSQWLESESDNEVDLWVARIPYEETRTYVQRVLGNLARYRYVEGGEAGLEELPLLVPTKHKVGDDDY